MSIRIDEAWAEHVRGWRESGETAAEYCERRGLKLGTLRYWTRQVRLAGTLRKAEGGRSEVRFAKVEPVGRVGRRAPEGLELRIGEVVVKVGQGFDEPTLGRLLRVLGQGTR
jgi:hypothetical protein